MYFSVTHVILGVREFLYKNIFSFCARLYQHHCDLGCGDSCYKYSAQAPDYGRGMRELCGEKLNAKIIGKPLATLDGVPMVINQIKA